MDKDVCLSRKYLSTSIRILPGAVKCVTMAGECRKPLRENPEMHNTFVIRKFQPSDADACFQIRITDDGQHGRSPSEPGILYKNRLSPLRRKRKRLPGRPGPRRLFCKRFDIESAMDWLLQDLAFQRKRESKEGLLPRFLKSDRSKPCAGRKHHHAVYLGSCAPTSAFALKSFSASSMG